MRISIPFGLQHPSLGEVIILCAVAIEGKTLDEDAIQAFLKQRLATYKLPRKTLIFPESALIFTGNQKIRTDVLVDQARARLRDEAHEIDGVNYSEYLVASDD